MLLGVTGGIAAYKSLELVRLFRRTGWEVQVVMTRSGRRLVGVESFRTLSHNPVATELFPRERPRTRTEAGRIEHVELARSADLVVVAPATANILGKLAAGVADDLLSTLLLAVPQQLVHRGRVIFAPAMNANMWQHPSVRNNINRLGALGYRFVGPEAGELACGTEGPGRMAAPERILAACHEALTSMSRLPDLTGRRVLVTAGRTEEPIDPVRVITNRSSGRMGIELARACAAAGAEVTLLAGPVSVPLPEGINVIPARTVTEMAAAVCREVLRADALIMCAAVADYAPLAIRRTKAHSPTLTLRLKKTPNILEQVARLPHRAVVVGFSLDDSLARARAKLASRRLAMVVANPPATAGADRIRPVLLFRRGRPVRLPLMSKERFARELVSRIAGLLPAGRRDGTDS